MTARKLLSAFACFLSVGTLQATPEAYTSVKDSFFGSHKDGYSIMRKTIINHGRYYDWEEVTSLIEIDDAKASRKETVLLHQHLSFEDADTRKPLVRKTQKKDQKFQLGELLEKYGESSGGHWYKESMNRLTRDEKGAVIFDGKLTLFTKEQLKEVSVLKIDSHKFSGAMNNSHQRLFLKFVKEKGKSYHMLESFETIEAVNKRVKELPAQIWYATKGADLQVWSRKSEAGKFTYVIVVPSSLQAGWEGVTGVKMTQIKSDSLWEKL